MKVALFIHFFIAAVFSSQSSIPVFKFNLFYEIPDTNLWKIVNNKPPSDGIQGILSFKHIPIFDSKKRPVQPMIFIVYQKIDSMDAIVYSMNCMGHKPFKIRDTLLGGYPEFSLDKHSIVFGGQYFREGVSHKILLCYIATNKIGIEIICDSTEEIYEKIEADFKKVLKSVYLKTE